MLRFYKKKEEPEQKDFSAATSMVKKSASRVRNFVRGKKKAAKDLAWKMEINPKETVKSGLKSGIEYTAEHPVLASGKALGVPLSYGAGYALGGVEGATAMASMPVGVGTAIASLEPVFQKASKGYNRATKAAGEKVRKSKKLDQALDSLVGKDPKVNIKNAGPRASLKDKAWYNLRSGISDISNGVQAAGRHIAKMAQFSDTEQTSNDRFLRRRKK